MHLFVEFLSNFISYYLEREKGIQNIVAEYKKFFVVNVIFLRKSAGGLLADDNSKYIFRFSVKNILKEYSRII